MESLADFIKLSNALVKLSSMSLEFSLMSLAERVFSW